MKTSHRTLVLSFILATGLLPLVHGQVPKWSQLPATNLPGLHAIEGLSGSVTLADDWLCAGGDVVLVRWWGNFELDPAGAEKRGSGLAGFHLSIHDPDPLGGCLPGDPPLWSMSVPIAQIQVLNSGLTNLEGSTIYEYAWPLDVPFPQLEGNSYWLDIRSQSLDPSEAATWRWQESSRTLDVTLCPAAEKTLPAPGVWTTIAWSQDRYSDMAFELESEPRDYGDAPEGVLAYPSTGVLGAFPTCRFVGPAGYVSHGLCWGYFGPSCDFEPDGNAGLCPTFGPSSYDQDECFGPPDAGLIVPASYTITGSGGGPAVVLCPQAQDLALGYACTTAQWGPDIDILVNNGMPVDAYVNVLVDWGQDGSWGGSANCLGTAAPEHVLVDFLVPMGYSGPLSGLGPPPFLVGPNRGYSWARFSITEVPVGPDWDGSGAFEDGETEDYLLKVVADYPANICAKWKQPPDCEFGVDVPSWREQDGPPMQQPTVADDYLCDGRPVTGIEWWGSYLGYEEALPAPDIPPPLNRPQAFRISWYTDVPVTNSMLGYSHPGALLFSNDFPVAAFGQPGSSPGMVYEEYYCTTPLYYDPALVEHEYRYTLLLPEEMEWLEKEGTVYWVGIEAIYPAAPVEFEWGWKTTPRPWHWNDDAVESVSPTDWAPLTYPPRPWPPGHPYDGETVDMAFSLLTDICPARCKKWEQPPDMEFGDDMDSFQIDGGGPLRADDFRSDGRLITDIHWWGSYINWDPENPGGSATNPVPFPTGQDRVQGFFLSMHEHVTALPCGEPGTVITNIFVPISQCHEVYYGTVTQAWKTPVVFEHEYQYYVDLMQPGLADGGGWPEEEGVRYWLNIQAVMDPQWMLGEVHNGWGWKLSTTTNLCPSVLSVDGGASWGPSPPPLNNPGHPSEEFDLSFELTTSDPPTNARPVFTNIHHHNALGYVMISTCAWTCGKQVLQGSLDLNQGEPGWYDIYTNPLPLKVQQWSVHSVHTHECYRVKAVR